MPLKKRGRQQLAKIAGLAALALAALPSSAFAANCYDSPDAFPAFQSIDGDTGLYFAAPGGTFEGRYGYQLSGDAKLVYADHGSWLAGPTGAQLASGGSASTGSVCLDVYRPHTRFAVKALSSNGTLDVQAVPSDGSGAVTIGSLNATDFDNGWDVTPALGLTQPLQLVDGTSKRVSLRLVANGGTFIVDGIAVDPYRR
jgi:hypothetical protein